MNDLNGIKMDFNKASSLDIDERVRLTIKNAMSMYKVDGELLRRLNPSVVISQNQCKVCAVSEDDLNQACELWFNKKQGKKEDHFEFVNLMPYSLNDIYDDFIKIAKSMNCLYR